MRTLIAAVLMALPVCSVAQEQPAGDDIGGFKTLVAEKLKEAKPVAILSYNAKPAVGAFLPVWTFHDARPKQADYVEVGIGGRWQTQDKAYPYLGGGVNIVALSQRAWDFQWARDHVRRARFPDLFVGPSAQLPIDIRRIKAWKFLDQFGVQASVRF